MKERPLDPRRLDLPALCRASGMLHGQWPQAALQRLTEGLHTAAGDAPRAAVDWQAEGQLRPVKGGEPELWLTLQASTTVTLQCQRCLQPMAVPLAVQQRLRFVADEDEAARLDELSEDDVLALTGRLDLQALVEDELILALPLVPRHDTCPQPLLLAADALHEADAGGTPAAPHPFAALAVLRTGAPAPSDLGAEPDPDPDLDPDLDPVPAPMPRKTPPH